MHPMGFAVSRKGYILSITAASGASVMLFTTAVISDFIS
jgi:hypothetical protein